MWMPYVRGDIVFNGFIDADLVRAWFLLHWETASILTQNIAHISIRISTYGN